MAPAGAAGPGAHHRRAEGRRRRWPTGRARRRRCGRALPPGMRPGVAAAERGAASAGGHRRARARADPAAGAPAISGHADRGSRCRRRCAPKCAPICRRPRAPTPQPPPAVQPRRIDPDRPGRPESPASRGTTDAARGTGDAAAGASRADSRARGLPRAREAAHAAAGAARDARTAARADAAGTARARCHAAAAAGAARDAAAHGARYAHAGARSTGARPGSARAHARATTRPGPRADALTAGAAARAPSVHQGLSNVRSTGQTLSSMIGWALAVGMDAVGLEQRLGIRRVGHALAAGTAPAPRLRPCATRGEQRREVLAVVARRSSAAPACRRSSTCAPAALPARAIAARLSRVICQRQAAQRVVAAELDHHVRRLVLRAAAPAGASGRRTVVSPLMLALTTLARELLARQPLLAAARPSRCRARGRTRPTGCRRPPGSCSPARRGAVRMAQRPTAASARATLQCAAMRGAQRRPTNAIHLMSDPIIAVEHVTKQVTRLHRHADDSPRHRFHAARAASRRPSSAPRARARARCCRSSPGWTRRAPARCGWPAIDLFALDEDARAALRAAQARLRVPELPAARQPERAGERDAAAGAAGPHRRARRGHRDAAAASAWASGCATTRACCRAASSSAWRWRAPSSCGPRCCWPTSRPAAWTSPPARRVMELMFELNREAGTTLVLVTHDRAIAARCDRQLRIEAGPARTPAR